MMDTRMTPFLNKVYRGNALDLLRRLPTQGANAVITDPMYMVAVRKGKSCIYDWGPEPGSGSAQKFWAYHEAIYHECRRVLKPGGTLAWAMGCKFRAYFGPWFGGHRIWGFSRYELRGVNAFSHIWLVQTKERTPIPFPDEDVLLILGARPAITRMHPCPKTEEEMLFLVRHLTKPGQVVVDCFCGTGTTLVAAQRLGRLWVGCDLSKLYCQIALNRLAEVTPGVLV